jgi:hypothetical protein
MNMISTSNYWKINGAYNICLYYVYRYVENRNRICISCRKPSSGVLFVQLSGYSKKSRFRNQPTVSSLLKIGSEKFAFCLDCNTNFMSVGKGYLQIRNIDCGPSVCMVLLESRRRIFKAEQYLATDDGFI